MESTTHHAVRRHRLPMIDTSTLALAYRTMTAREMAEVHGVTHEAMRQRLSRYGIASPRRDAVRHRRALVVRLWWRGSAAEIAEYLGIPTYTLRRDTRKVCPPANHRQYRLFA